MYTEDVEPVLRAGMDFLRDDGRAVGCYANRYMTVVDAARETTAAKVLVATETGMIHQLEKVNSTTEFVPVNRAAVCKYMKMITPAKLLHTLRTGEGAIDVAPDVAARARRAVEAMVAIGEPGRGGE